MSTNSLFHTYANQDPALFYRLRKDSMTLKLSLQEAKERALGLMNKGYH